MLQPSTVTHFMGLVRGGGVRRGGVGWGGVGGSPKEPKDKSATFWALRAKGPKCLKCPRP